MVQCWLRARAHAELLRSAGVTVFIDPKALFYVVGTYVSRLFLPLPRPDVPAHFAERWTSRRASLRRSSPSTIRKRRRNVAAARASLYSLSSWGVAVFAPRFVLLQFSLHKRLSGLFLI